MSRQLAAARAIATEARAKVGTGWLNEFSYYFKYDFSQLSGINGSPISTIPDASGTQPDAIQAMPSFMPTLATDSINGLSTGRFTASPGSYLSVPTLNVPLQAPFITYVVGKVDFANINNYFLDGHSTNTMVMAVTGNKLRIYQGYILDSTASISNDTPFIGIAVFNSNASASYVNGNKTSGNAGSISPITGIKIVNEVVGLTGNIGEIGCVRGNNETKVLNLLAYLSEKWGITVNAS